MENNTADSLLANPTPTPFNPFKSLNYCTYAPKVYGNSSDYCWFVRMDLDFYTKVISMGLIVTVGLIGNIMLGLTILLSKRLRSKSVNVLIVLLTLSNILNLALVAPNVVVDSVTEFYVLGEVACQYGRASQVFFFVVPMLTLLSISIDRYAMAMKQTSL